MGSTVTVNGLALSHKGSGGTAIATLPDVCKTPSPGGPVPIPYPNVARSSSLAKGTGSVTVDGGQSAAVKGSEYGSSNGDEAGTAGGVKSSTNMKEATWITYSFDVKFEGKNACRLTDKMQMNHGNTACLAGDIETGTGAAEVAAEITECPCCHGELHDNQRDPATGKALPVVKERDWYQKGVAMHQQKANEIGDWLKVPANAARRNDADIVKAIAETTRKRDEAKAAMKVLDDARANGSTCPNLHNPADQGCGTHFARPASAPAINKGNRAGFTEAHRSQCIKDWKAKGFKITNSSPVAHKTPLAAGGCPIDPGNLIPNDALSEECKAIDKAQTDLQGAATEAWRRGS